MDFFQNCRFKESYNMAAEKSQSNGKLYQKAMSSSYEMD